MEDNGGKALMTGFMILGVFAMIPIMIIVNGYIIADMWEWFILPVFTSMPALTIGQAIGLGVIVSFMCKYHKIGDSEKEKEDRTANFIVGIIWPFLIWLTAYIIHLCIS